MVKVGDKIRTESGITGVISNIWRGDDGRYVIYFKDKNVSHYFIEGDEEFEVVEWEGKY